MAKPKGGKPKLAQCSPDEMFRALKKVGGFKIVYESAKHTKVAHLASGKCSTIPRQPIVNKFLLRDFVNDFLIRDCGVDEKELYKYLWC